MFFFIGFSFIYHSRLLSVELLEQPEMWMSFYLKRLYIVCMRSAHDKPSVHKLTDLKQSNKPTEQSNKPVEQ